MGTLDERYLDGPNVGYCSSSDEDEPEAPQAPMSSSAGPYSGPKTGPKGVLADYRESKERARLEQMLREKKMLAEAERFAISGVNEDKQPSDEEDDLEAIRKRRLEHLKNASRVKIVEIPSKEEFLHVIEGTSQGYTAVIHIYREDMESTHTLNEGLLDLAALTKNVRYFKVRSNALGMTKQFNEQALPTLQIYQDENLVGNFVRITDTLTEDFDVKDLKDLLAKNDVRLPMAD